MTWAGDEVGSGEGAPAVVGVGEGGGGLIPLLGPPGSLLALIRVLDVLGVEPPPGRAPLCRLLALRGVKSGRGVGLSEGLDEGPLAVLAA